jgi:hypothetical protein
MTSGAKGLVRFTGERSMKASDYLRMFSDDPLLIALSALVLFIIIGPLVAGWVQGRKRALGPPGASSDDGRMTAAPPTSRFLGTQMDLAIVVVGILLLLAVLGWIFRAIRG